MKSGVHANWFNDTVVTCGCGHSFVTGSTLKSISVDVCGACHPFYTGQNVFSVKKGRVEKFLQKQAAAQATQKPTKSKQKSNQQLSLKEMLKGATPSKAQ